MNLIDCLYELVFCNTIWMDALFGNLIESMTLDLYTV